MPPEDFLPWVALSLLPSVGPILARRALNRLGDPASVAFKAPLSALESIPGFGGATAAAVVSARRGLRRLAEDELRACERLGIRLLTPFHPEYPAAWEGLSDAPVVIYVKGSLQPAVVRVAIVGSRRATAYGRRVAAGLAEGLAIRGIEVVSGGARGIDTCAHVGALESGGRTIAVLGAGFHHLYPTENEALFDRIAANGAVMSEFPLDIEPRPENFPRRNRLISGLSAAVVLVEATVKSGSLITASHALEQGREVLAVPGPVSSEQSQGCHRMIQQGAKLVQKVEDILEDLSPMYASALLPSPARSGDENEANLAGMSADEAAVFALLDDPEPVHLDDLADGASFGIARVQAALFGLEVRGVVEQLPGRYYLGRPRKET